MECKVNSEKLCFKECIFKCENEVPADAEFILPDYCSPIKKVLTYRIEPAVTAKNISGNSMNIEGVAAFKMIYLDDQDCMCSFDGAFVFSKTVETQSELSNVQVCATVSADRMNCRVISERRVTVKGSLILKVCVNQVKVLSMITGCEDGELAIRSCRIPAKKKILFAEKNIIIEDELSLSDSHAQIGRILNYCGVVQQDECRVMNNKVMLRGSLLIKVTYLSSENFSPCHFEQRIPYSQVCDVDGLDEACSCSTEPVLTYLEVKCRNSGYDESRTLLVNAKLCVNVEAACCSESEVALDVYSLSGEATPSFETVRCERLADRISDSFTARKTLEFTEGAIGSVTDIWCDVTTSTAKRSESTVSVFGIVYIRMIVCNTEGVPEYCERAIDFEYKCNLSTDCQQISCDPKISISNLSYIIKSDSCIDVLCEMNVGMDVTEICELKAVTAVDVSDIIDACGNDCAIVVCYVDTETDIWSVAKKYRSRVEEIKAVNGIDSLENTVKGAVIIPVK